MVHSENSQEGCQLHFEVHHLKPRFFLQFPHGSFNYTLPLFHFPTEGVLPQSPANLTSMFSNIAMCKYCTHILHRTLQAIHQNETCQTPSFSFPIESCSLLRSSHRQSVFSFKQLPVAIKYLKESNRLDSSAIKKAHLIIPETLSCFHNKILNVPSFLIAN